MLSQYKSSSSSRSQARKEKRRQELQGPVLEEKDKEAMGENKAYFLKNLEWLDNRWTEQKLGPFLTTEGPLIGPALHSLPPLSIAIIADNLEYFEKHYGEEGDLGNPARTIKLACLCGAKNIAKYVLGTQHSDFTEDIYQTFLGDIASSNNEAWALEVAALLAREGCKLPSSVYGVCENRELRRKIVRIFEERVTTSQEAEIKPGL